MDLPDVVSNLQSVDKKTPAVEYMIRYQLELHLSITSACVVFVLLTYI